MTAFVPKTTSRLGIGSFVKFSDVKFSIGIRNISSFKITGKFVCEKSGLYIVSVSIELDNNSAECQVYVNGKIFTKNYKYGNSYWLSTSASITIELKTNDSVWVQIAGTATDVRGDMHSRFTIIKIH